jgi:penicillin-binding protein 1A
MSARRSRTPRRRSRLWRYRRALLLAGILLATAASGALYVLFSVPLPEAPSLEALNQTTYLTDAAGRPLAAFHGTEDRTVVRLADVPPVLRHAVVAAEDRSFYRHRGLDPIGILRAIVTDVRRGGAVQGGSTITQQYARNASFGVGRERSLWRKLREAIVAVKLERRLSKDEILERYLNTIYFGRGAYGVQAASRAWFGKDVRDIGLGEAALLAGIIRSPVSADPTVNPALATARRRQVLAAMQEEGYVSAAERAAAERVPVSELVVPRRRPAAEVARPEAGTRYFVEHVRRLLVARYGEQAVYAGGLRVRTTLDLDLQAAAYRAVYGVLDRPDDPAGALVALDAEGRVRAMVGGRDWSASQVNLATGRAGGGRGRQGGSTFKPFVLAAAVAAGYSVDSVLPAPAELVLPGADDGRDWRVRNYDGADHGELDLVGATVASVNTVYAQLVTAVGPEKVVATARAMGVRSPLRAVPSIALGTQEVSVLEMADAYLTLANRGVWVEPTVVTEVRDASGNLVERFTPEQRRVLPRAVADVVNHVLRRAVEEGTGRAAAFGRPVAGKTGTTQDYGDAWFIGYTPRLVAAVWMGYPEGQARPMRSVHGRAVTGGSFPAVIFRRFMSFATARPAYAGGDFPVPEGLSGRKVPQAPVPSTSGPAPGPTAGPATTVPPTAAQTAPTPPTTSPTTTSPTTTSPPASTSTTVPPEE